MYAWTPPADGFTAFHPPKVLEIIYTADTDPVDGVLTKSSVGYFRELSQLQGQFLWNGDRMRGGEWSLRDGETSVFHCEPETFNY